MTNNGKRVIFLGIDGMDPVLTKAFMDEGVMPNVSKLAALGAANESLGLIGIMPTITPPGWATLGTGAYPSTHGITDFWTYIPGKPLNVLEHGFNSKVVTAEFIWDAFAKNGDKVLVYHFPTAWPPSDEPHIRENLIMIDGTQPAATWYTTRSDKEKILEASVDIPLATYIPYDDGGMGEGCVISEEVAEEKRLSAEKGLIIGEHYNVEVGSGVQSDIAKSPIKDASGWANAPADAKEFIILVNNGADRRHGLILKNDQGIYDTVAIYRSKKDAAPQVTLDVDQWSECFLDAFVVKDTTVKTGRYFRILNLAPDASSLRLYVGPATNAEDFHLCYPQEEGRELFEKFGIVKQVSVCSNDPEAAQKVLVESWRRHGQWSAQAMKHLIDKHNPKLTYSHFHSVDLLAHALMREMLECHSPEHFEFYYDIMRQGYILTDEYIGEFMEYLEDGNTSIVISSDHGLIVGQEEIPLIGDALGINCGVMGDLGYTVLTYDEKGKPVDIDWSKTVAVAQRSGHIFLNLKGRNEFGIVEPEDYTKTINKIIDDLYSYRDKHSGERIISLAVPAQDMPIFGLGGERCGDIYYFLQPEYCRIHGDSLSTYAINGSSMECIFLMAGAGVKQNYRTNRKIRHVDVAATIADLVDGPMPAHCEGAPLYQLMTKYDRA